MIQDDLAQPMNLESETSGAELPRDDRLDYLRGQSQTVALSRRDFGLALTAAGLAGPGLIASALTGFLLTRDQRVEAAAMAAAGLGKLAKRPFGTRMGEMKVTPVCISQDWNKELFGPALDVGMNFVHKAGYWGKRTSMPEEFKRVERESYFTDITVDNTSPHHDPENYDEAYYQVVNSLAKNGLKYYDIYRAHYGWHTVQDFKKQGKAFNASYKAFLRLKKESKVRYFGVSQHPYISYPEIIEAQIDSGIVDAMQVWCSYGVPSDTVAVFAKASKAGIGMTAMKVFAHGHGRMRANAAKMRELKAPGRVGRALIRDVMTLKRSEGEPVFHTCVTDLQSLQHFEENVGGVSSIVALRDNFDLPLT